MVRNYLLVDADLRRPTVHERLGLDNSKGLSDLLSSNATGTEVLHKAMPFVEFYAITAGTIPPDPVKLLSSKRMRHLMKRLERDFDLIVYDAPPLVGLADATLIAPHTDGLVLVSRVNYCDRKVLEHAMDNISFTNVPVLGLVANGIVAKGGGYKYYSSYGDNADNESDNNRNGNNRKVLAAAQVGRSSNGHSLNDVSIEDFIEFKD